MKQIENSSNLVAADFNAENKVLIVEFKGGTKYSYPNFPPELYAEFEKTFDGSSSGGKFFNAQIRNMPCEKLDS